MTINPLDALIASARQKEAEKAELQRRQKENDDARRRAAAEKFRKEQEAKHFDDLLNSFSQCFLGKVVKYVCKPGWTSSYLEQISAYSLALLSRVDVELPKIDERHADAIFNQFDRTLDLYGEIPEGYLFGERLFNEHQVPESTSNEPVRIRYSALAPKMHTKAPTQVAPVLELHSATTPKGTKGGRPSPATMPRRQVG